MMKRQKSGYIVALAAHERATVTRLKTAKALIAGFIPLFCVMRV
jgi:hypothetical protein